MNGRWIVPVVAAAAVGLAALWFGERAPEAAPAQETRQQEGRTSMGQGDVAERKQVAYLAGGCFWGMEEIVREIPGVLDTDVGYTGGVVEDPRYEDLKGGASGHAEAIRVEFDPAVLAYDELLLWFFRMHDPTTPNRQGNDIGSQYRSAIFYVDEQQKKIAEAIKEQVDAAGHYRRPIVTEIVPASTWYSAEGYHQDYLQKHPNGYTCHFLRDWD